MAEQNILQNLMQQGNPTLNQTGPRMSAMPAQGASQSSLQNMFGQQQAMGPGSLLGRGPTSLGNNKAEMNIQQLGIDPALLAQLSQASTGLQGMTQNLQNAAGNMFTNFGQFTPSLNTNFQQFNPSAQLDNTSRNMLSQGQQGLLSQANAQANAARRNVGGGAGNILAQQAEQQARIQQNPLFFQAAQDQRGRELQQFQTNQQQQQLMNAALMQQAQQQAQFQQMQNQAGLSQGLIPLQAQSALLGDLGKFAQLTGQQQGFQQVQRQLPGGGFQTIDINAGG